MRVLSRLDNVHQVAAAIGDPEHPWFHPQGHKNLTSRIYPVPGGALVVERRARPRKFQGGTRREREWGEFRVFRVSVQGDTTLLRDEPMSLRGAQMWAEREAARLGQEDEG